MKNSDKQHAKKPYRPPVLERYGDVRKITRNVGGTGKNDNMSSSTTKTGL